jgi:FMN-dependent NADH-azoreductase
VTIAGRTFSYAAPGLPKGLLFGKKAYVVATRGGDYGDPPMSSIDFQEPLLRANLGLIGIYDVTIIKAEGMRQRQDDAESIISHAEDVIMRLAA